MEEIHEGNALTEYIRQNGVVKVNLAERIGIHVNTLNQRLAKSKLRSDHLLEIGRALRVDITSIVPRMKSFPEANELHYFNSSPESVMNEVREAREEYKTVKQMIADRDNEIKLLKSLLSTKEELIQTQKELLAQKDKELSQYQKQLGEK